MKKERITVTYDSFRTNFIPERYQLDRQLNYGKGQKSVLVKIDNKYYDKLKKLCSQRSLSLNRAINFAIVEFLDCYLIRWKYILFKFYPFHDVGNNRMYYMENINSHTIVQCIKVIHSISRELGSIAEDVGVDFDDDLIVFNEREKAELILSKQDELRTSLFRIVRELDIVTGFYSLLVEWLWKLKIWK